MSVNYPASPLRFAPSRVKVATMVAKQWHIASYQKSLLSSLALLTSAAGAIVFGHIAAGWWRCPLPVSESRGVRSPRAGG